MNLADIRVSLAEVYQNWLAVLHEDVLRFEVQVVDAFLVEDLDKV